MAELLLSFGLLTKPHSSSTFCIIAPTLTLMTFLISYYDVTMKNQDQIMKKENEIQFLFLMRDERMVMSVREV